MAEYVHQTLEEMIPELEEMNRVGLFTKKETKIILKSRENYEYRLRQLTKTKQMYLSYIEYETKLLELMKLRRKKAGQDTKKRDIEKSIADRIHKLFRLATTRFPEDLNIWEKHIEFSRLLNEKGYVTRLYNQALKLHSHNEDLWIKAAQWENSMEGNNNSELAREILLKAQRTNPECELIILEMFQMELELAKQIIKRKRILGISTNQEDKDQDENEGGEEKIPELKLSEIVYKKAIDLFPGNAEFHMKLLHISCRYKEARSLQQAIVEDLQNTYSAVPLVWNGLALRHLNDLKKMSLGQRRHAVERCLKVFVQAVEKVSTEEMWSLCLRAHLRILGLKEVKPTEGTFKSTLALFEKALQLEKLSEDLYLELLDLLTELGADDDVERLAVRGTEQHPHCPRLWLARFKAIVESGADVEEVANRLRKVLKTALRQVPAEASWSLWQFVLNHLAMQKVHGLEDLMETACRSITSEVCVPAKEWCLHWTFRQGGLKSARNVYSSLKTMRPTSLNFFRLYVQIECAQVEPNFKLIRAAFEEALTEFGQTDPDLWLNYIEMERVVAKDTVRSGVVRQRALHGLDPHLKESFIRKEVMQGLEY